MKWPLRSTTVEHNLDAVNEEVNLFFLTNTSSLLC